MSSDEYLDLEKCSREGISRKDSTRFVVRVGNSQVKVENKTTTCRDLLKSAGLREDCTIFKKMANSVIEKVQIDDQFDLAEDDIECFLTFDNSVKSKFTIDGVLKEFEGNLISDADLIKIAEKEIADFDKTSYDIWCENPDGKGKDRKIKDLRYIELRESVKFFTVPPQTTAG